ncbi:alpha/beta hydrolase family protein [Paenibacillus sp. 843]|uniref:alpha/beta hydrolase family protein n=1 Tax=Paenibacillus sp. 843 TaxID=3341795 RepID=UPI003727AB15
MNSVQELEQYICTLYDTRDQLKAHVFERSDAAFAAGDTIRDAIVTAEAARKRQEDIRAAFLGSIGGLPNAFANPEREEGPVFGEETSPDNSPLKECSHWFAGNAGNMSGGRTDSLRNGRTTGSIRGTGFQVEKVMFESLPGYDVTSNLYLPDHREERSAAVLFLSGHELGAKHDAYYQRVIQHFVRAGIIVLAIDPIGQGERLSLHDFEDREGGFVWGTKEHQQYGVQCHMLGDSVARYFVHDAMRAIDYLCERPEVDSSRIGVTGNSGGGTQTAMLMVSDERIAAAAPATFIMNRQLYMHAGGVQDAEQVWPGLSGLGYDHEDLLIAFAPKPLIVLAAEYDFFPIEGTRRTVDRCRRFWELLGHPNDLQLVTDASTHRYTDRLAAAAAEFFVRHLEVKAAPNDAMKIEALPPEQLWCSPSGQVYRDNADARTIRDFNADRYDQLAAARSLLPTQQRQDQARQWLLEKICAFRKPCELNPRIIGLGAVEGLEADYRLWWSQEGIMNSGYVFRLAGVTVERRQPLTVAVWRGGTRRLKDHWAWIRETCRSGRAVLVLNTSGVGPHEPYPIYGKPAHSYFGVLHKLADDLIWLGDSLAALRTHDVLRCMEVISHFDEWQAGAIPFYTVGREGLYVQLAAEVDRRIGKITAVHPVSSAADLVRARQLEDEEAMSVVFPGIFKVLDPSELNPSRGENRRRLEGKEVEEHE